METMQAKELSKYLGCHFLIIHNSMNRAVSKLDIHDLIEVSDMPTKLLIRGKCKLQAPKIRIEPIELTEEWLINFEFTKTSKFTYEKDNLCFDTEDIECWLHEDYNDFHIRNIKFVHQLQNLYFALTSKELNINTHECNK